MKLDLLVMTVHPDDAELGAGGVIAKYVAEGKTVGIVDLTLGELGTRGTAEIRAQEAQNAAKILNVAVRENLKLRDGFFQNNEEGQREVIKAIRKFQPEIVITNAWEDRHPDHGRASKLVNDALFLAGLRRIETELDGQSQEPFRPRLQLQLIQDKYIQPDILIDITEYWDIKEQSILAYTSQFNVENQDDEPQTYISNPDFMDSTKARAHEFGRSIQVKYAEGFTSRKILGVKDLFELY
ncbi:MULTISPECIES: bacillithiol biosynthesis deacetylase BshB1 [Sphingobacterium]|uniref:Bacillithiol biosynthesis deacetylase BshB1 n=1 Tax=Sphingobacterium cellulitidis TaxID=1768011 RepID=A0A8H9G3N9_9SPHI|nr:MULTISPECIES: bacillithiol biosynthesis deacetylase BshB1 [Sphingobacterium]MBA8988306.1 bacillithiol biosynthesis deacetylase BshB1 [Sphingobacterium soli]OYD42498.1 bacillithiol biosynthesis deacetylase BshB1 [Sphingobacterium cellulitidis]WFB65334.1 bacillithiol biosynthesis deacetylase BshB1 [Sphingobacterium sp. WM]GGE32240.1 bacillithiol biosynthesis deacetylase BshB1 [Sphingobacterium soli]